MVGDPGRGSEGERERRERGGPGLDQAVAVSHGQHAKASRQQGKGKRPNLSGGVSAVPKQGLLARFELDGRQYFSRWLKR